VQIKLRRMMLIFLSMANLCVNISASEAKPLTSNNSDRQINLSDKYIFNSVKFSSIVLDFPEERLRQRDRVVTESPQISQTNRQKSEPILLRYYAQSDKQKDPPPDKSKYNLFNPTPRKLWRDFATDRPDKTTNPFTIDAGRFSIEADLFVYTKGIDRPNDSITETYNYFVPNFKVGLTNNIDLQVSPVVYNVQRTKTGNRTQTSTGFGDTTVRVKVNFWGNDGGNTAFGMMPFVKIPTAQNVIGNGSVEGGIIFPFVVKLSDKWDLAFN
jgi:Putative MetA-pathway of phenol degradation